MPPILLVMAGGAIGAGTRFLLGRYTLHQFGPGFPWGTLGANIIGGFAMGLLVGILARYVDGGEGWRLFVGVGLLGGFTTFSAFSLETVNMIERGAFGIAIGYALVSVLASVGALFIGLWIVRATA
ncbi:fluoride efflux transporter CrcB [Parasphingopyxis marina]|uniref:Fluoride-specific ion channel FluC n=1 Tax=Parasphingopyxis marina TaxID=2761622 RepID=A0A842HV92_9SPHN|nr:fluoride efflux transporter CrcB [Parasphingopyxis marina]MBC2776433.1 fluoride efflux transporter CrcB [Parasphingopyxis marina]